jgi:hypothetical protein
MIQLISIFALTLLVTDHNQPEMMNISRKIPVFGMFYAKHCAFCLIFRPTWQSLEAYYANDSRILIAQCDCTANPVACQATAEMTRYPSFFVLFGDEIMAIRPNRTLGHLVAIAGRFKHMNPDLPCHRHHNQSGNYPYLLVSYPDSEDRACTKLLAISNRLPAYSHRILLADQGTETHIRIQTGPSEFVRYDGPLTINSIVDFALDYFRISAGNWPLSDIRMVHYRRCGFFVVSTPYHIRKCRMWAESMWKDWCFGIMNLTQFQEGYPALNLSGMKLPYLALFNRDKNQFKLMSDFAFSDDFKWKLGNMTTVSDDLAGFITFPGMNSAKRGRFFRHIVWTFGPAILLASIFLFSLGRRATWKPSAKMIPHWLRSREVPTRPRAFDL